MNIQDIPKFVINLDKRFDRLARFNQMAKKAKLGIVERFKAYSPDDLTMPEDLAIPATLYACGMSHIAIWQMMIENDWPYVMIFEDDAVPTKKKFNFDLLSDIERIDMLMLGGNHSKYGATKGEEIGKNLYRCTFSLCGHAYIISNEGAKYILEQTDFSATAIDVSFGLLHDLGHSYYIHPSLYVQMPDYSDIWLAKVNYMDCVN
jgi:GR25 family glycosyltransferase involved in LPS biosynthesis